MRYTAIWHPTDEESGDAWSVGYAIDELGDGRVMVVMVWQEADGKYLAGQGVYRDAEEAARAIWLRTMKATTEVGYAGSGGGMVNAMAKARDWHSMILQVKESYPETFWEEWAV